MSVGNNLSGPKDWPVLGCLPSLARDPLVFYSNLVRDHYPMAHFHLLSRQVFFISEPPLVEMLLVGQHRNCVKDFMTQELRALIGQGLVTNEGESWRRQRKLAAPLFSPKSIAGYTEAMARCGRRHFAAYQEGQELDFHTEMMGLTLEVVGKVLLGFDPTDCKASVAACLDDVLPYFAERLLSPKALLPAQFPTRRRRRFKAAKRELDALVARVIAGVRAEGEGDFLLARLVAARDGQGQALDDQLLADEALTMLLAGHETTALCIMFAAYSLAADPSLASELRAEVDTRVGERLPTVEALGQMPLLDAVVSETLRLYPAAPALAREVAVPFQLGGCDLPRGAFVMVSPYAMQRSDRFFSDPHRFNPRRWLDGSLSDLPKFSYIPFGGGPRNCIGQHFARLEVKVMLVCMLQQIELRLMPGFSMALKPVLTIRSRDGLPVRIHRRERSQKTRCDGGSDRARPEITRKMAG